MVTLKADILGLFDFDLFLHQNLTDLGEEINIRPLKNDHLQDIINNNFTTLFSSNSNFKQMTI